MFRKKEICTLSLWVMLIGVTVYTCAGCFPTTDDVNALQEADHEFVAGLHDAGNELMTDQHSAMTPELAEAFATMKGQYDDLSRQLKERAGETRAEGISLGALGGEGGGAVDWAFNLLGLGWLLPVWNMFFGKSRASDEISALKLRLATGAKAGNDLPSDKA